MRKIKVINVVTNEEAEHDTKLVVRFPVEPPTWRGKQGEPVRLRDDEGIIDVTVNNDGSIEVRGRHALVLETVSANVIHVRLRDASWTTK